MLSIKEINLLQAQNEGLKKQNAELQKEIAELKAENFELKESLKCFQTPEAIKALTFYKTGEFELQEKKCIKLEQENLELKENFEGQRNAYKKLNSMYEENCEYTGKLEQTLQEIKAIATECTTCGDCSNCKYTEDCDTDLEEQALGVCKMILEVITKAGEE